MDDVNKYIRKLAMIMTGICLNKLVMMNFVKENQVESNWRLEFNKQKLSDKGLAGAATLDQHNFPVLYLLPSLNIEKLMIVISHESIHIAQICRGSLIPGFGYNEWMGKRYKTLKSNAPEYFELQPWEKEAEELQPTILEHLKSETDKYMQDSNQS